MDYFSSVYFSVGLVHPFHMRLLIVSMIMQSVCINLYMVYSSVKNVPKQCLFVHVLTILREKRGIFAFLWGCDLPG